MIIHIIDEQFQTNDHLENYSVYTIDRFQQFILTTKYSQQMLHHSINVLYASAMHEIQMNYMQFMKWRKLITMLLLQNDSPTNDFQHTVDNNG